MMSGNSGASKPVHRLKLVTSHDFALLGRRVLGFFLSKKMGGGGCGIFGSVGWKK